MADEEGVDLRRAIEQAFGTTPDEGHEGPAVDGDENGG
jgi:hypothetical protein